MQRLAIAASGLLPPLLVRVPDALPKQAVEVGEGTVAADEKPQAFGIRLARPFAIPHLTARIVRIEPNAPERRVSAMGTAFNVASDLVLPSDRHSAVGTGVVFCARFRRAFACSTRCRGRRIDDPSGRPGAHT